MTPSGRPVTVGVGRSGVSSPAVAWAADEAARRRVPLRLVHALEWPPGTDPHAAEGPDGRWSERYRASGRWVLSEARDAVSACHPETAVESRQVDGVRSRVLRDQADEAGLLVVGVRQSTAFEDLSFGAGLAAALASHAVCPVA